MAFGIGRALKRRTRRRGAVEALFPASLPALNGRKVLVYSPVPWDLGRIELGVGLALKARGFDVSTLICGGVFSACEMENAKSLRPDCDACRAHARAQQAEFGFVPRTMAEFLRPGDFERARTAAAEWDGNDLAKFTYEGMPVGANVANYLHNYYHAATYRYDAGHLLNARRCMESSILHFVVARRMLATSAPEILILTNGKNMVFLPFYYHAQLYGIRVVTWDEYPLFHDALIWNHSCFANETHLEKAWDRWRDQPLSPSEDEELDAYIRERGAGRVGTLPVTHGAPDAVREQLTDLGWSGRDPVVAVYPNIAWDTAVIGMDIGFESLAAWLGALVDLARSRPGKTFVIRVHPHEAMLPTYFATATPTAYLLRQHGPLPSNLLVVPAESKLNSYALGMLAEHRLLYTGTLGLEFAVGGQSSLVCADVHYRGKGFTVDITGPDQLASSLDAAPVPLTREQHEWARRYFYLLVFRHMVRLGVTTREDRHIPDEWFSRLLPGRSAYWQDFLDAVVGTREFDFGPSREAERGAR